MESFIKWLLVNMPPDGHVPWHYISVMMIMAFLFGFIIGKGPYKPKKPWGEL